MRILVLSDFHGNPPIVKNIFQKTPKEELDLIVVCGDITHYGNLRQAKEMLKVLTDLGVPLLFVPGNCDPKELVDVQSFNGATNLHGRCREIKELGFLGVGGSPPGPFNTPFEIPEDEIKKLLDEAYGNLNIKDRFVLISHVPPIYTKVDLTSFGVYAGSRAVREFVEISKPSLVLCGHIHEARGTDTINSIPIINPGPAHRGLYAIVDVNGGVKIKLCAL